MKSSISTNFGKGSVHSKCNQLKTELQKFRQIKADNSGRFPFQRIDVNADLRDSKSPISSSMKLDLWLQEPNTGSPPLGVLFNHLSVFLTNVLF